MNRIALLPDHPRPLLFAHRGCSSLAPENTMAAFKTARELHIPGIELDTHVCASGELIVAHDDTFERTAGDPRIVEQLTLDEIRSIDVGSFFAPAFKNERVPLLKDVLEEFCPAMYIDIEMKTRKIRNDPLPGLLANLLKTMGDRVTNSVTVSSFNPMAIRAFRGMRTGIPTAVIWGDDKGVPPLLRHGEGRWIAGCDYLKPQYAQVSRFSRFWLSKLGRRPMAAWTVDDPSVARKLAALGTEGIITNRPQDMPAEWRLQGAGK
ncbi:glycerophosphodiester phosphodiesterase [Breznakiella homolactica]|uniref:Glycerophosphodiester phosphodiesterase n=1 Tax=Breznakiella homolactica TaxID=2798577 RepID=A0A7T8B9C7_9SPIR|nr:glycerophosphodiester phosphodiesterase family protein [Breznakiella homolactica]QQO09484.1 glycerophosphodiester phosphodiesterase [Breznakiella homolactica]